MTRYFVGIDLPAQVRTRLAGLADPRLPGARWTRPENLHITLYFIGDTDIPQEEIDGALGMLHATTFDLQIAGVGVEPAGNRPARYVWAGVRRLGDALDDLHQDVKSALGQVMPIKDHRPYQPHITLARFKNPPPSASTIAYVERYIGWELDAIPIASFVLYSSLLLPGGAEYRIEETYSLHPRP